MLKKDLRKQFLERRRGLAAAERARLDKLVAARFFEVCSLESVSTIHCFLPIEKFAEIDTRIILDRLWRDFPGIQTVAPRVDFVRRELEHLRFSSTTPLYDSEWNIPEPVSDEFIATGDIDLVLVPLLAVDKRGYRVGYGKGFYDRFLINCREDCRKIGLSLFPPVEKIDDLNENDVRLDYCLTPDSLIKF